MAYICHDTVKTTAAIEVKGWMSRVATWLNSALANRPIHQLDPRNEHLLRDAGLLDTAHSNAISRGQLTALDQLPYSKVGGHIRFIDLFLNEHLDRGPR